MVGKPGQQQKFWPAPRLIYCFDDAALSVRHGRTRPLFGCQNTMEGGSTVDQLQFEKNSTRGPADVRMEKGIICAIGVG